LSPADQECLRTGPVDIVKRNQPAAVVLSEDDCGALCQPQRPQEGGMTALQLGADHLFVTGDLAFRKVPSLNVRVLK
jgi:hypothetical protein